MTGIDEIRTIAVLGAGHGGCAAAADLTRRGFRVRLHARSAARLAPLRERGGVEARGVQQGFVRLTELTTDIAEALDGAHDGGSHREHRGGDEQPHRRRQVRGQHEDPRESQERDRHESFVHSHGARHLPRAGPLPRPAVPGAQVSTVEEADQWFAQWPADTAYAPLAAALKGCAFLQPFAPCCAKRGDPPDLVSVMSSGVVVRLNPATAGNGPLLEITR